MRKKRKIASGSGGKFKASWKLPQFITPSTKGGISFSTVNCVVVISV